MTDIALQIALSIALNKPGNYNRLDDRTIWTIFIHITDKFYSAVIITASISRSRQKFLSVYRPNRP